MSMFLYHIRFRDEGEIVDFSFDICASGELEAVDRARRAMLETIDNEGFIDVPVTGGAVNGKIAIDPMSITSKHIISANRIEEAR